MNASSVLADARKLERNVCLADPNAFVETVLKDESGEPLIQYELHEDLQEFWDDHPFSVTVLPREHGKSTQALGRIAFEIAQCPEIRVKYLCSNDRMAANRIRSLRRILSSSECVKVAGVLESDDQWSVHALTVKRKSMVPDPTVEGWGIFSSATGSRCDLLVADDPVTMRTALLEPELREKAKESFFSDWMPMLAPSGRVIYLATPWHEDDLTMALRVRDGFSLFERPCVESPALKSPWPERWTAELLSLRKRQMGSVAFARAFLLKPIADEDRLVHPDWIHYSLAPPQGFTVLGVDPAISRNTSADYFCMVGLRGSKERALAFSLFRSRLDFRSQIEIIESEFVRLRADVVAVENVAYQQALVDELQARGKVSVVPVRPVGDKYSRVARSGARFQRRELELLGQDGVVDPALRPLYEELITFPVGQRDDTCDALSVAEEVMRTMAPLAGRKELALSQQLGFDLGGN